MVLVFLIYGLAFVVLGVAILVAPRTTSHLAWARDLQWIGWFGVLHGANEWIDMLDLVEPAAFGAVHDVLGPLLMAASFVCLLVYGGRFLARDCQLTPLCRWLPVPLVVAWGIAIAVTGDPVQTAHVMGRYLLGFPGATLTGFALIMTATGNELQRQPDLRIFLRLAGFGFLAYALTAGLMGPPASYFPASIVNQDAFQELFGFPIQLVRAACAVVIALGLGRLLGAIDRQTRGRLQEAHDALETRVAQRTAELQAANEELVAEAERRDRLQTELLKTEKLESLGVFAGGIAHDYNNLLTAILGSLSLAERQLEAGHPATETLARAEKATRKAQDLAQRLLTFARGGEPVPRPCSIADILEDACSLCLSGSTIRYDITTSPDLPAVVADPGQMTQVFNNVVTNARQAMPDGGNLRIHAEPVVLGQEDVGSSQGRYVRVTVTDEGKGISAADLEHVFDPFFSRREDGNGLGLAVAHSVIRQHGGMIDLSSREGDGTTVTVVLPTADTAPRPTPAADHPAPAGSGRVLVMDDDELIRETAVGILERQGYDATATADGDDALAAFESAREDERPYVAVILDLTVPGGMGGRETLDRLRAVDPDVPVIVSSGYSTDPVARRYEDHGFQASLPKPYSAEELCRAVADVVKPSR